MTQQYQPGQRWISDSEAELGLGTVLTADGRLVTVLYPASGETRQYSQRNAPLTRVRFAPGEVITHFEGWKLTIEQTHEEEGLLFYCGHNEAGEDSIVPETQLSNFIQFRLAADRLFAGQVDRHSWFTLRYQSLQHRSQLQQSELTGLVGARAQTIAHQLHIAKEVTDRAAPRVLLADEVGLGKTIEAGLIIHRQVFNGHAARVLILLPESLQYQWLVEMRRRFNLEASLFDQERFDQSDAANPFEDCQITIVSLQWITHSEVAQQAMLEAGWDLLVVDEAHHLTWSAETVSPQYQLVEQLAEQTPSVLLLTATPEQLGQASHFARLRLLDPNRFHDLDAFIQESEQYQPVAEAVRDLLEQSELTQTAQANILSLLGTTAQPLVTQASQGEQQAIDQLISQLIDRHGTGRLLFRNTRASISGFPSRQLQGVELTLPEAYQDPSLATDLQDALYPDQWYRAQGLDNPWWMQDTRIDWLIEFLKAHKEYKVLVICAHASTAQDTEEALRVREGIAATVFHEGMSIIERDRAAAWFADAEDGAQVLICSEIGSEGRNFQFSHHLVLFDLPQNPDLLEQRIGRLDRIGQRFDIQLYVPYYKETAQARLFDWYHQALNAFESISPAAGQVQTHFQQALLTELTQPTAKWPALLAEAQTLRQTLEQQLQSGRDRLLEINSSGQAKGQALAEAVAAAEDDIALPLYMEQLFNAFGVESEDHSDNALILRPSEKMLDADFPLGTDEAVTITFNRELALAREDMQFLTWEHPMVQGGMDLVLTSSMGNTALVLLKNKAIKPGTLLLELIFVSEALAPKALQLGRFLPSSAIRCLLDSKGNDLAANVSYEVLSKQVENVGRVTAGKFVRAQREQLQKMLEHGQQLMEPQHQTRIEQAKHLFSQNMQAEISRLSALQQVNKNIRADEIELLEQQLAQGLDYLTQATLRLEAIRVIVSN